ncbi:MAG: NAD(P)-dependent oxidoreductase, partial [Alphaproteobacteria bacterium HGW-Alphaproteobacteria-2]
MTGTLLSFGHGYSAQALGRQLITQGWRVIGTTRSPGKADALATQGVEPLVWPGTDIAPAISASDHLLVSAAPGPGGDPVLAAAGEAIGAAAGRIRWLGYLSTTAVYGDRQGAWVDEDTPPAPTTPRGAARLEAERAWQALAERTGLPLHIFRLAGIYGPGRGPFEKLREGRAERIVKPG